MYNTGGQDDAKKLEGMASSTTPINDWIHGVLREPIRRIVPDDDQYTYLFDKLEMLISLSAARHFKTKHPDLDFPYFVLGRFGYRSENAKRSFLEIQNSISIEGDKSPYVMAGIVANTAEESLRWLDAMKKWILTLGPLASIIWRQGGR